jgi:predicted O-methyltransferase YrrM/GR25 family glycosyltransferase involved in LPS biosynthesis
MKKLMIITPHLSTGGQPQFLLKKIELLKDTYDLYCVEYNFVSPDFVVQRNKIKNLLILNFISLEENELRLTNVIKDINPDIIWFEELPETFITNEECEYIYKKERSWQIIETTHSSQDLSFKKRYAPDKFIFVSDLSVKQYDNLGIESSVIQYPVNKKTKNTDNFKSKLSFDNEYKHIVIVGLFTQGKNQSYAFDIARKLEKEKVLFHFVGNTAINFKDYWEPLLLNKPKNCILHGEKENIDDYLQASDLFLFPSKFELNPLVVKEALCYDELPIVMFNLESYCGQYDNEPNISFMKNDINIDSKLIKELLFGKTKTYQDIEGWFSYEELYNKFVNECSDGSTIVEIGSWFGKSTKYISDKIKETNKNVKLISVDTFKGSQNEQLHIDTVGNFDNDIYQIFYENLIGNKIEVIKDSSHNASKLFNNGSIDYLMIDGDHSYEGVKNDIEDFFYKVKPGGIISGDDYVVFDGVTKAVNEYFNGTQNITTNGYNWYYKIPKIQVIHISTLPKQKRAIKSITNIKELKRYNIDIKFIENYVYDGEVDVSTHRYPESQNINKGHYGCYLAHKEAIHSIDNDYDYTIIMEEDAYIFENLNDFVDIVHKAIFNCIKDEIYFVSFGGLILDYALNEYDNLFNECWHQTMAHCYMIPNKYKQWYVDKFETSPWDSADLWFNHIFCHDRKLRLITKKFYSKQLDGTSLIDNVKKEY